jgi:hypothetical protein
MSSDPGIDCEKRKREASKVLHGTPEETARSKPLISRKADVGTSVI